MSTIERLPRGAVYCGGKLGSDQPDQLSLTTSNGPICSFLWLLAVTIWGTTVLPQPPAAAATFGKARTGRAAREEAIRAIPFDQLTPEVQNRIAAVVSKPSVHRRLPVKVIDCDPSLYLFLVRQPEVVVNIWELMGITQIGLKRAGPFSFVATDGMGTKSKADLVYGTNDTHLVYAEGVYDGPLLRKPINGRCVLLLRSGYVETAEGRVHVTNQLDVFLQLDHVGLDILAKTIHPFFGRVADLNFVQTVAFLERISRTAERNGPGMQRLANRLTKVDASVREQFAELTASIEKRSAERLAAKQAAIPTSSQHNLSVTR